MRLLIPMLVISLCMRSALAEQPPLLQVPFDADAASASRSEWAAALGSAAEFTNSIGMPLVLIPPGRFTMGPNGSTYRVTLRKPFYVGTTEVTLGQYRRFQSDHRIEGAGDAFNADDRPAAMVNWIEAREFCDWLSNQPAEREAGRRYSLPTEAQWEWAARAGTRTSRYFGDDDKRQREFSWFNHTYTPNPMHETGDRGRQSVAGLPANAFGLHDMLGNVWEWCDDRRSDDRTGEERTPVMRGGSWRSGAFHCTAVAHDPGEERQKGDNIGFRVVCTHEDW